MDIVENNNKNTTIDLSMDLSEITAELKKMSEKIQGLVEVNARLTHELIHIKSGAQSSPTNNLIQTPNKTNKVVLTVDGDITKIGGNTFNHRSIFRDNGGSWNGVEKVWEVSSDNNETIVQELELINQEYEIIETE